MDRSCFSLSVSVIKENFRRFWTVPAVGFLAWFLIAIIPIMAAYKNESALSAFTVSLLYHAYPFSAGLLLVIPIISVSLVFRYLHQYSSAAMLHALPLTKSQLFNSNFLSGLLFSILPVLFTGALLLCLVKPAHLENFPDIPILLERDLDHIKEMVQFHENIFTYENVLIWIGGTLLVTLCIYSISTFAGMITGSSIIFFFTSLVLSILATGLTQMVTSYFREFLFGYKLSDLASNVIYSLSPLTGLLFHSGRLSYMHIAFYLAMSLGLIIASSVLYRKRRLERSGNAFIFRGIDHVVCYIITFFGMSLPGIVLFHSQSSRLGMYLGLAGGCIASFAIGRMIVSKSLRIFDRAALKSFLLYAAAAAVFLCALVFDFTGYVTRLPDPAQVEKVTVNDQTLFVNDNRFDASYYKGGGKRGLEVYRDPKNIRAVTQLQRSIIESDHPGADSEEDGYGFDLHYYKNGMDLQRSYFVNSDFFQKNKTYKRVYESREFKDFYSIKNLKKIHQSELSICSAFQYNDLPLSKEDKKEIVVCLEKDFYNRTYEEQMDPCHPYGTVNLTYKVILPEEGSYLDGIMFNILRSDKHTIRWLNDHGYSAEFEPSAKDVESLQVYTCAPSELETILREEDYMNPQFSSYYKKAGDIRNAKQIKQILTGGETMPNTYACQIIMKKNSIFDGETFTYFYSSGSAPEFLKQLAGEGEEK